MEQRSASDNFFITLMSNSSLSIFPDNTTTSFTVSLPQKITLPGKWEVGVAEIHYNYNFFNVTDGNNRIWITSNMIEPDETVYEAVLHEYDSENEGESGISTEEEENKNVNDSYITKCCEIPPGFYNNMHELIETINGKIMDMLAISSNLFLFNKTTNRCELNTIELEKNSIEIIKLEGRLNIQLGFIPCKNVLDTKISQHCCNIQFGVPDRMLIYTDIIEPTFIGHEKAYVIRIVSTQPKGMTFGDTCYVSYERMDYIGIEKREFEAISIDIREPSGNFMPFLYGVLTIKLHFRKRHG